MLFSLHHHHPPRSTLFPYTTLFRSTNQILRFGAKGGIINVSRQATGTSRVLTIGTNTGVGPVTAGGADNTPGDLYLIDRKSTRLNSSHANISYAVFCLKKKKQTKLT